ncbi:hypothetical protein BD289DRAFT_482673 [Coniella lustricola]|uniref:Uncharacterized protein n=1 Tax=Coniella lustricola TaxID=2025994 RepID=A0A2T3A844_9PEZI|nr:hypothetical protein BD289DRAFT_482673 [Coniella lustricola]
MVDGSAKEGCTTDRYTLGFYAQQPAVYDPSPYSLPHADHQAAQAHMQHEIELRECQLREASAQSHVRLATCLLSSPHQRFLPVDAEGTARIMNPHNHLDAYNNHHEDALRQELELLSGPASSIAGGDKQMRENVAQSLRGVGTQFSEYSHEAKKVRRSLVDIVVLCDSC